MRLFHVLVAAFAVVQALRYARRAFLFLVPRVGVDGDAGAPPRSAARLRVAAQLEELGFVALGIQRERAPLGAHRAEADVYADPSRGSFADVAQRGAEPQVTFVSPFPDGAFVVTADHRRPSASGPMLQAGGLPGASLEALLAAHEVAVERFAARHGTPAVATRLEARLAAARGWWAGFGRWELRRAHAPAMAVVAFAIVLLASSVSILLRGVK
ncbi:MAG TPA: hypothetical protein VFP65_07105 [Anaeromyxobacteraceae bacterium]|nr:hypothetical protein [Anaeromyxobacteraceae bacterium]